MPTPTLRSDLEEKDEAGSQEISIFFSGSDFRRNIKSGYEEEKRNLVISRIIISYVNIFLWSKILLYIYLQKYPLALPSNPFLCFGQNLTRFRT
jgi:hypothetical protein